MEVAIGNFIYYLNKEVFDDTSSYRELLLIERINGVNYYVNPHKDTRFPQVDFRFPPDEKKFSEEEFKIKFKEFVSFEHRKDCQQPLWKLHLSTVENIISTLIKLNAN